MWSAAARERGHGPAHPGDRRALYGPDNDDNLKAPAIGCWGDCQQTLDYLGLTVTEGYKLAEIESRLHQPITDAHAEEADGGEADEASEDDEEQEPELEYEER
ncbi:hypothetical protein [Glycomyces salinus]|uniref:hypothetical protein n=1 Tax=Glycomyces salinus TaxID=980294 RepID=UPI0018ECAF54|nr:hypothetical protein [Glycomyces salinus]